MNTDIALILAQDGMVNGAIYALLALSLVLVFAVTRVVLIPQGELVAYAALTDAALQSGQRPGSLWLLGGLGGLAALSGAVSLVRRREARSGVILRLFGATLLLPAVLIGLTLLLGTTPLAALPAALLSLAIVTPMAAYMHRIAFQPLAGASVLVLLIAAIGVHWALAGLGLIFFGPEGARAAGFTGSGLDIGGLRFSAQALGVLGAAALVVLGLYGLFGFTLPGKALRATAVNGLGARLVGIPTEAAGRAAFTLAGFIGAVSGVLIVPLTTIYYDSGFLIGLKGFIAAIVGGMVSYPLAAAAALILGIGESFTSFWASDLKDVIVFMAVLPILLFRSLRARGAEEEA
jgi:branched-chain amino acid transport system permease protein